MYADIQMMNSVFAASIDSSAKIVLFAIIYHANKDTHEVFPSWRTLVDEFESGIFHSGFDGALITAAKDTPDLVNKTIGQIAREQGKEPIDAMCDLLISNHGVAQGV